MTIDEIKAQLDAKQKAREELTITSEKWPGFGGNLKTRPWRGRSHGDWRYFEAPELFDEQMAWLQDQDYFQYVTISWHQTFDKVALEVEFDNRDAAMMYKLAWGGQ